jgi:hypothetical protein
MIGTEMDKKKLVRAAWAVVLVGVGIQLIRPEQTNPPFDPKLSFQAAAKPTTALAALMRRSCMDCHSHETVWPWYSQIAPGSWLITRDVRVGRKKLNLSEWGRLGTDAANHRMGELCDEVEAGKMPPSQYLLLHPSARLTKEEVAAICSFEISEGIAPTTGDGWANPETPPFRKQAP